MTKFVVENFGIQILYGRVMHGNEASVRVVEKNGYEFVREEFGAEDDPYGKGMLIYKKKFGKKKFKMEIKNWNKKIKKVLDNAPYLLVY